LTPRIEEMLLSYSQHSGEPGYCHLLGGVLPAVQGRFSRLAVVLDHNAIGDASDYRRIVTEVCEECGLCPVFLLDGDEKWREFIRVRPKEEVGRRLSIVAAIVKSARLIISRSEDTGNNAQGADMFIPLGIGAGHGKAKVVLTRV